MNNNLFRKFYYEMLRIRLVEEKIAELYPKQEIRCPVHLCIGQEAVPVGVCTYLKGDSIFSNHRSHGHYLAKGGDLKAMMAELFGKKTGCSKGKGGSMHLIDLNQGFMGATPIVGGTIPIAVGAAFASRLRKDQKVTAVFFGEAAIEEGIFSESVNFAVLKELPIVFVCENNLYSVYSPLSVRQPEGREVVQVAKGLGIEIYQGDGNDVVSVSQLAQKAIEKARNGSGPCFLEFKTYRWLEHCGPSFDNDLGYREVSEFQQWKKRCPLERLKKVLLSNKICSSKDFSLMTSSIEEEINEAISFARKSPFPEKELLLEGIYA